VKSVWANVILNVFHKTLDMSEVLGNFHSPDKQTATFVEICNGLLFRSMNQECAYKIESS